MLKPLNALLQSESKWHWSNDCQILFVLANYMFVSAKVLAYCDPKLPLQLAGDASAYGMDAAFSHKYPDGSE